MADMEALKEQLMNMKRNGKGFLCVGTDDPEEAAAIMKIAAELSQEKEEEEQYEDEEEEKEEPKQIEYAFDLNGTLYSDDGIAELVAENYEDLVIELYKNDLTGFFLDLETDEIDYLKDRVLKKLDSLQTGHTCMGIKKKTVWKRSC